MKPRVSSTLAVALRLRLGVAWRCQRVAVDCTNRIPMGVRSTLLVSMALLVGYPPLPPQIHRHKSISGRVAEGGNGLVNVELIR